MLFRSPDPDQADRSGRELAGGCPEGPGGGVRLARPARESSAVSSGAGRYGREGRRRRQAELTNGALNQANWGGRTRTSNFPVNSRAVCQLTYTPMSLTTPRSP